MKPLEPNEDLLQMMDLEGWGNQEYLKKPVEESQLLRVLSTYLARN